MSRPDPPASYLARGKWPSGELLPTAPAVARYAQLICQNLEVALVDRSLSAVCRSARLNPIPFS